MVFGKIISKFTGRGRGPRVVRIFLKKKKKKKRAEIMDCELVQE